MDDRPPDRNKDPRSCIVPPPPPPSPRGAPAGPDPITAVIPYNNPKALAAYYLGIVSFFPLFGLFSGIAAFVLGIQGLKLAQRQPEVRGKVHAWIGIVAGGILGVLNAVAVAVVVAALLSMASEY